METEQEDGEGTLVTLKVNFILIFWILCGVETGGGLKNNYLLTKLCDQQFDGGNWKANCDVSSRI